MGKRRKRSKLPFKLDLKAHTLYTIVGVLLISIGLLVLISFSGQGVWLNSINSFLISKLGLALMFLPFIFISSGLIFLQFKWPAAKPNVLLGTIMIFLGWMSLFRNGEIGLATNQNLGRLLSAAGAVVFSLTLIIVGVVIMAQMKLQEFFELIGILKGKAQPNKETQPVLPNMNNEDKNEKKRFSLPGIKMPQLINKPKFTINPGNAESDSDQEIKQTKVQKKVTIPPLIEPEEESAGQISSVSSSVPTGQNRPWQLPPLSLLDQSDGGEADRGDVSQNADMIEATLDSFGIKAKVKEVNFGPSVTQYALEITRGTKLSKITGLSTDLALALAAPTGQIRIEAPIAGRSLVGIEVPNHTAKFVTLRKMLSSPQMQQNQSKLLVALGIDVANRPYAVDISRMPHMLIAGATGSGKSVALNSFLCSILFRASPDEVKLILVDPKRVELSGYNNIPHLLTPVIVETKQVVSSLKWTTHEMEERYKKLSAAGVRHIDAYNELAGYTAMYRIVVVVDELADVMLFAPADVEENITRIAQMARAVGIHLLLATQRPSVDVLTGLIKANIPARIAFNVSSMMDSRVILDTPGAEKLLGRGDMLFIPPDRAKPLRLQGTFVSDDETKRLIEFVKKQGQQPEYLEEVTSKYEASVTAGGKMSGGSGSDERDELFLEVAKLIVTSDKASSSMIQRRFSLGYNRAARILDQLYAAGMVGPAEGSKPRTVNAGKIMEYIHSIEGSNGG